MSEQAGMHTMGRTWSRRKKDPAPRGVFRHRSGVWAVRYTCGAGHVHQEKIGTLKSDAIGTYHERRAKAHDEPGWCPKVAQREARVASQQEALREEQTQAVTVQHHAERWLREHVALSCKPRTLELYRSVFIHHIFPAVGALPLRDLSREKLRELLAAKAASGLSRSTLQNILIPLRAMLNSAVDDGKLPGNPAVRLGRFSRGLTEREARRVTALTAEELARLLTLASRDYPENADLLHVLAWTGLRLGEACGLQWSDIDLAGHFVEVNRAVAYRAHRVQIGAPKSGQARRVDLPSALVARLRARQSLCEAEAIVQGRELSSWVFPAPSDGSKPINAAHLRFKVWYRLLRVAGLRGVRLHDLRHTFASLLLQAGEPIAYVKEQLGHSSIQVTVDRYGHFIPGANRQAVERLAAATGGANANPPFDFSSTFLGPLDGVKGEVNANA